MKNIEGGKKTQIGNLGSSNVALKYQRAKVLLIYVSYLQNISLRIKFIRSGIVSSLWSWNGKNELMWFQFSEHGEIVIKMK